MTECYECAKLAELVAENGQLRVKVDEPANGNDGETNGIADGSPLVEPCTSEGENVQGLPDENVSYLLRDVAKKSDGHTLYHGATKLMQAIGKEPEDRRETGSELAVALNTLADMVERDYVSREAYEDLRDEFVWETTFLHRVSKKCGTKDVPSLVAYVAQLEAKVDELERADVSQAVEDTLERVTNDGEMYDSREKLEADANGYVLSWWHSGWVDSFTHANSMKRDIMRLLERQANITSCEWNAKCESEECGFSELMDAANELRDKNDELKAKVYELTEQLEAAHAKNRSLKAHIAKMQEGRHGWHVKYPELERKNAELQARVDELERENAKLQAGYDAIISKCAALCAFCGFSIVDTAGEVI